MLIDKPCCDFQECKHHFDGNCMDKIEYERCPYNRQRAENAILGEIRQIVKDNSIDTTIILDETAIFEALKRATPTKPYTRDLWELGTAEGYSCPNCGYDFPVSYTEPFCCKCGQKIKWRCAEMREIVFRGFTPDEDGKDKAFVNGEWIKGQWVQGSYMKLSKTTYCFKEDYEANPDNTEHYIVFDRMTDWGLPNRHLKADVLPETIGQFVGLTDKNNKRIFEGDIVKVTDDNGETDFSDGGIGDVGFYDGLWYVGGEIHNGLNDLTKVYYVEVIGNIHDNPELLKGGIE